MTESELLSAAHDVLSRMDSIFELWISGTFAVLVTFYFVEGKAVSRLKHMAAFLYISFSVLMFTRNASVSAVFMRHRSTLLEMGSEGVIGDVFMNFNFVLNPLIYVMGTTITLYFIYNKGKVLLEDRDGDT